MVSPTAYFGNLYDTLHGNQPWYGSGLEESLARIPEADLHKPVGHRTIAGLLMHMLAWRYDLIKRLYHEPRERIELDTPRDWPDASGKSKADFLTEFTRTKALLQEGLREFDDTNVQLLQGGVLHDIYHLGQANLIAALLKNRRGE